MQKVLLYYKFVPIGDPEAVRLWQKSLCERLNLKGRIIIAEHGINGTVAGSVEDLKAYVKETKTYNGFKDIVFKWSAGERDNFPKLSIKVRPEIVTFGVADKLRVDQKGVVGGGKHLKPAQVHELVEKHGDDVVFFDGRNAFEAEVGKFKNSVVPEVRYSRDFPSELASPKYESIKDKPVVAYCTGGIRCEVLTVLMKEQGFKDVYQIDGGIVKYGEQYGDEGLWEGSLYVFDGRVTTKFSDSAKDIGDCVFCGDKTSHYANCEVKTCNKMMLVCDACSAKTMCPECIKQPAAA